ncbi:MAG: hypothetical protein KDE09_13795 [Anaerolineales bacterium]|nr:hypothetical protein [Anaerolineales bacterium]MCB0026382.1 hypothetical protein [Anaerolineales bacterium]
MRAGKYARIERERRYHLMTLPVDLPAGAPYHLISDRYLTGTRLRLRQVTDVHGNIVARKLTQKELVANLEADETVITNIYLNDAEFRQLVRLPGALLEKRRYEYVWEGRHYAVDQFLGPLTGLLLAEIEDRFDGQSWPPAQPSFVWQDVTRDPLFRGGHLVHLTGTEFRRWQESWLASA